MDTNTTLSEMPINAQPDANASQKPTKPKQQAKPSKKATAMHEGKKPGRPTRLTVQRREQFKKNKAIGQARKALRLQEQLAAAALATADQTLKTVQEPASAGVESERLDGGNALSSTTQTAGSRRS